MASSTPIPPALAALFVRRVAAPARAAPTAPTPAAPDAESAETDAAPAPSAAAPVRKYLRRGSLLDIFV